MTPRPWTARHRDAMLTRVTVLTAGTAVLGTVGAVGIGVAIALTSQPKAATARTTSIDVLPSLDPVAPSDAPTSTPTPTPTPTVVKVATTRTTPAAKPVSRPTVTKRATPRPTPTPTRTWTPPPAPPRPSSTPTVTSGGS